MRRRRALVFDDDIVVIGLLKQYLNLRGYEVVACREPMTCPIYGENRACDVNHPCADLMIVDFSMPKMNGVELLTAQAHRTCKLTPKNKALITGYFDAINRAVVEALGCAFFEKPLDFTSLAAWVDECEQRMDLSQPLGLARKERRQAWDVEVLLQAASIDGIRTGIAVNKSPNGVCIKIATPLWPNQPVTVHWNRPAATRSAIVRWINKLKDDSYVAGLQFLGPSRGPATALQSTSRP